MTAGVNSWTKYELVWVQALGSQAKYQRFSGNVSGLILQAYPYRFSYE